MHEKGFHPKEEWGEEKCSAYGMALWCTREGRKSYRAGAQLCIESMDAFCGGAEDVSVVSSSVVADDGVWRAASEAGGGGDAEDVPDGSPAIVADDGVARAPADAESTAGVDIADADL